MSTRLSWGNASSARAWIAAFVSVLNGCAITTGVNVGVPSATRCLQTSSKNASVTMTAVGRKSGLPRAVHLACIPKGGDHLIVASAMGQEQHPAWRYNIEANPRVEVQLPGESFMARAELLSDTEKGAIWDEVREIIPQMDVYEKRTDRNIRVFRLVRESSS